MHWIALVHAVADNVRVPRGEQRSQIGVVEFQDHGFIAFDEASNSMSLRTCVAAAAVLIAAWCFCTAPPALTAEEATSGQIGVERMPLLMPDDFSDLHLAAWRSRAGRARSEQSADRRRDALGCRRRRHSWLRAERPDRQTLEGVPRLHAGRSGLLARQAVGVGECGLPTDLPVRKYRRSALDETCPFERAGRGTSADKHSAES